MSSDLAAAMANLTGAEKKQMTDLGLLITALVNPDMNMTGAVNLVLDTPPLLANLTAALENIVPDLEETLQGLAVWLRTVPHDNLVASITTSLTVMILITILCVALRIYSRLKVTGKLWAEDCWALAGTAFAITLYAMNMTCTLAGPGARHIWDMTITDFIYWNMLQWVTILVFTIAMVPIKLTFAVFYYRLAVDRWYRLTIIIVSVALTVLCFIYLFISIFACNPVDEWNHMFDPIPPKCLDRPLIFRIGGYLTIATDVILLFLPIWKILSMNLSLLKRRDKFMILGMFGAGVIINICNVLRVITFNQIWYQYDPTYVMVPADNWSHLEIDLAIVISCLPALKHLFFGRKVTGLSNLASKIIRTLQKTPRRPDEITMTAPTGTASTENIRDFSEISGGSSASDSKVTKSTFGKDEDGDVLRSYNGMKGGIGVKVMEQ